MSGREAKRLKELETENTRLKKLLAESLLERGPGRTDADRLCEAVDDGDQTGDSNRRTPH